MKTCYVNRFQLFTSIQFVLLSTKRTCTQCSNCRGVWGVEPPTSPCRPPTSGQNLTLGVEFQPPPKFAEVGMLLDSHFLLMQFLKYLGLHHDDLNATTS